MGGVNFFESVKNRAGLSAFLKALKWDEDGRVTVVAQDARSKDVLCVAFADRVAITRTLKTGLMHYYSRSRKKLWLKGETSGHFQKLVELRVDCDGDAILAKVHQIVGSCHLGFRTCFSSKVSRNKKGQWVVKTSGKQVFDPGKVYTE